MLKLKKRYSDFATLKNLQKKGLITIERNIFIDTHGTSGMGLVMRTGITVKVNDSQERKDYQIIFSSKGYGATTSNIVALNGRWLDKYNGYLKKVNQWLENNGVGYKGV